MEYVVLGRTGLQVNKNGFGALPIQRISKEEAGKLVKKAFENGINYFDTARAYSDSEEKMGAALADRTRSGHHQYKDSSAGCEGIPERFGGKSYKASDRLH